MAFCRVHVIKKALGLRNVFSTFKSLGKINLNVSGCLCAGSQTIPPSARAQSKNQTRQNPFLVSSWVLIGCRHNYFFSEDVHDYLSDILQSDELRISTTVTDAVLWQWLPTNVKELKYFFGLSNLFLQFVSILACIGTVWWASWKRASFALWKIEWDRSGDTDNTEATICYHHRYWHHWDSLDVPRFTVTGAISQVECILLIDQQKGNENDSWIRLCQNTIEITLMLYGTSFQSGTTLKSCNLFWRHIKTLLIDISMKRATGKLVQ